MSTICFYESLSHILVYTHTYIFIAKTFYILHAVVIELEQKLIVLRKNF
jgi:hypothetical protein